MFVFRPRLSFLLPTLTPRHSLGVRRQKVAQQARGRESQSYFFTSTHEDEGSTGERLDANARQQATKEMTPDTRNVAAQDRPRRSIHKPRLLEAGLKAGEKWKRRLCKAAR